MNVAVFIQVIQHDLISAYRRRADWLNAWLFFILIISLFPLAVTPDLQLLHAIAPGLIWVAALLAMLLSLGNFLRSDYEDGSLSLLLLSPCPLSLLMLAKIIAFWLMSSLPLIIITPLLALMLHLTRPEITGLLYALLLGTPTLCLLGAVGMALTVGLKNQNLLLALLILPLCVPVLVFGAGAVINIGMGLNGRGALALLGAIFILAMTLAPIAASAALRIGYSQ